MGGIVGLAKRIYLVETLVTFRHRYLIEETSASNAEDTVVMNEGATEPKSEWTQKYLGETIISTRAVTPKDLDALQADSINPRLPWDHFVIREDN